MTYGQGLPPAGGWKRDMPEDRSAATKPKSSREHFERLMAEGKVEEAERYIRALEMFVKLAGGRR